MVGLKYGRSNIQILLYPSCLYLTNCWTLLPVIVLSFVQRIGMTVQVGYMPTVWTLFSGILIYTTVLANQLRWPIIRNCM
jgi:hypothetical protein